MPELIWDGKYDEDGNKRAPVRIALPFQTVETVNESVQQRQTALRLFESGREGEWRNRLIWGDKKYVLPSLLPEFADQVNLIYIDPPFDTGADFSFKATIPDNPQTEPDETTTFVKEPSIIEQKAYRDTWGEGLDSYLQWFYETILLLRELLAQNGSVYVHADANMAPYLRLVMSEIFGAEAFRNEIYWYYTNKIPDTRKRLFTKSTDTILFYALGDSYFEHQEEERETPIKVSRMKKVDGKKIYVRGDDGRVEMIERKTRVVDNVWRLAMLHAQPERTGYPTQKPEPVLERIINASSNEGDLVLDCFCGSGTTPAVAEKLGRRWIACDLGRFAIHTTRKRLLGIENVKPFVVQNLGKYERQQWQVAEFDELEDVRLRGRRYRDFVLGLYHAEPVGGHTWLHGAKAGRMVHVGAVDAPVTLADVKAVAAEVWQAAGTGKDAPKKPAADILGWDFAFELNETAQQVAAEAKVDVVFKRIPREVLDRQAIEQGDVYFFELAALSVDVKRRKRSVTVELTDFIMPPDDVPEDVASAITHWSQWIDYWAIDWDYKGDAFHNQWQSYRTKQSPDLQMRIAQTYEQAGEYRVMIKVIDILGNDTTHTQRVEVS